MKKLTAFLILSIITVATGLNAGETEVIEFFNNRDDRVTLDSAGHAIKLFSGGKPALTLAELTSIGALTNLEELAINAPPAGDGEWGFLKKLAKLKKLTIWHGHHFSNLTPFCDLPVKSLTLGGCMGLRNLNKETPKAQRDAILTLRNLPNLTRLMLYHSPIAPDDTHIAHLVANFPKLTELQLDFIAPYGQEVTISKEGIASLSKLKLSRLTMENAYTFAPDVFSKFGEIKTLKTLHIQPARRDDYDSSLAEYEDLLSSVKKQLPGLEVTFQKKK